MLVFEERVGAEPKFIPTPEKAEPKKPAKADTNGDTKQKETKNDGKDTEAQKHKDADDKDKKDVHH